jgi:hypothetical protein
VICAASWVIELKMISLLYGAVGDVVQPSAGIVIDRRPDKSVRDTMMSRSSM